MHTSLKNKTTLVTGVTSGIGREIAKLLAERGARVFGTVRNPQTANPIHGVEIVRMEVTDDASVNKAIQSVEKKAGPVQLLVNNAGYVATGALEETSIEEAKQQFDTNFFGVLRVTNAVLPGMRQGGYGRIVNISSVLGFLPAPYQGMYAASKHAVEGYTETLDHEVRRFGVRAMLIEPAYTKTKITGHSKSAKVALEVYAAERKHMAELAEREVERGDDPGVAAIALSGRQGRYVEPPAPLCPRRNVRSKSAQTVSIGLRTSNEKYESACFATLRRTRSRHVRRYSPTGAQAG